MSEAVSQQSPGTAGAHRLGPPEAFEFGRRGGNMLPASVSIDGQGKVTASGNVHLLVPNLTLPQAAMDGLLTLARAEHFFSLPDRIGGIGNPDVGSLFITVQHTDSPSGPTQIKTVEEHQAHNAQFDQLFAVLVAAAAASF